MGAKWPNRWSCIKLYAQSKGEAVRIRTVVRSSPAVGRQLRAVEHGWEDAQEGRQITERERDAMSGSVINGLVEHRRRINLLNTQYSTGKKRTPLTQAESQIPQNTTHLTQAESSFLHFSLT